MGCGQARGIGRCRRLLACKKIECRYSDDDDWPTFSSIQYRKHHVEDAIGPIRGKFIIQVVITIGVVPAFITIGEAGAKAAIDMGSRCQITADLKKHDIGTLKEKGIVLKIGGLGKGILPNALGIEFGIPGLIGPRNGPKIANSGVDLAQGNPIYCPRSPPYIAAD